ncbi:F-box domain-containing protein [Mycena venus]|uniref:F-box domain-containing protein n=1 Tax=Mycena venus TaxID=2733690 RepID=A0A8H7CSH7_9AGAR|nr:F-box domain-containing protein [Mycena venus]
MEPIPQTPYSYGPFTTGALPRLSERAQLQTILRSNGRSAAPAALTDYRLQVAPTTERVAEYDEEIAQLQSILNRMVANREVLQYHADACSSVSAPIRRLPDDLLLQIFRVGLWSQLQFPTQEKEWSNIVSREQMLDHWRLRRALIAPLYVHIRRLAQVCASWRDLVLGSPILWSAIELDFDYLGPAPESRDIERVVQLTTSALERSADAPLQIYVRSRDFGYYTDGSVLDLLSRHSNRWKIVKIWAGPHPHHFKNFKCLAPAMGNLPLLETLHISGLPTDCDFFEVAPRLTELTLEDPIPVHAKLPWGQLQAISYTRLYPEDLPTVISQLSYCPQITRLAFYMLHIPDIQDWPIIPAFVSNVDTFVVKFTVVAGDAQETVIIDAFLESITLRRCKTLHLETECKGKDSYPLPWPPSAFLALSSRSAFHDTLLTLEILNLEISATQLLECLSGLPRLEALLVSDPNHWPNSHTADVFLVNDVLLRGLTSTPDSGLLLVPRLHSFDCRTYMQFEDNSYLNFIASRVGPGRNADGPFQSSILYYRGFSVKPLLAERLSEFVLRKQLESHFECDYSGSILEPK